jgi:hypothetical protein
MAHGTIWNRISSLSTGKNKKAIRKPESRSSCRAALN